MMLNSPSPDTVEIVFPSEVTDWYSLEPSTVYFRIRFRFYVTGITAKDATWVVAYTSVDGTPCLKL